MVNVEYHHIWSRVYAVSSCRYRFHHHRDHNQPDISHHATCCGIKFLQSISRINQELGSSGCLIHVICRSSKSSFGIYTLLAIHSSWVKESCLFAHVARNETAQLQWSLPFKTIRAIQPANYGIKLSVVLNVKWKDIPICLYSYWK